MGRCRNCDTQLNDRYCPACGQKDVDLDRPFLELLGEIVRETFDLDGRALRTAKTLFLQPGQLTAEYLAGKRRTYTPPLRLYLFISVSFFVVMAWVAGQGLLLDSGQTVESDAASQARFMSETLPRMMFVLLPIFALLLKAVFRHRHYIDHVIFSVHLHSASYVILALLLPFEGLANRNLFALVLQVGLLAYFMTYLVMSMRRVYDTSWIGAIAKALLVLLVYMMIISALVEATSSFLIISD